MAHALRPLGPPQRTERPLVQVCDDQEVSRIIDPVCDMIVDVEEARDKGLTIERPEREYAFCAQGCLLKFAKSPNTYIPKVEAWLAHPHDEGHDHGHHAAMATIEGPAHAAPAIDTGIREWYQSCRCCLSEAYPQIVEQLDAEKAQAKPN
jgi:YHS domain-containing protein